MVFGKVYNLIGKKKAETAGAERAKIKSFAFLRNLDRVSKINPLPTSPSLSFPSSLSLTHKVSFLYLSHSSLIFLNVYLILLGSSFHLSNPSLPLSASSLLLKHSFSLIFTVL